VSQLARLVTFRRGAATYGIDVRHVRKVLRAPAPRPLPSVPAFVVGGILVDGRLEVLVDVAAFFDDADAKGPGDRAVLVTLDGRDFALRADGAGDVTDAGDADLQRLPPFLGGRRRDAIRGVLAVGREQILVLDLERLLAPVERDAVEAARTPASGGEGGDR
jgi:chemotaxis signal transduction protein